jgi:hypothetical protein
VSLRRLAKPRLDLQAHAFGLCHLLGSADGSDGSVYVNGIDAEGLRGLQREAAHSCLLEAPDRDQHEQRRT